MNPNHALKTLPLHVT